MVAAYPLVASVTAMVEFGAIQVDVAIVAKGLGIEPPLVRPGLREGRITSLCERGVDEDEGRNRVTFFSENRPFRVVIDSEGKVVRQSATDFGQRGRPALAPKLGA